MPPLRRFDHVGITVADLDLVAGFFVGLGFEIEGRTFLEGPFLDTVCAMQDARTEMVVLRLPGGGTGIELAAFVRPEHEAGSPDAKANVLGMRSLALQIDDLDVVLGGLADDGYHPVGGVGSYEGGWRMVSVRGPEGIVVSLAERTEVP